MDLINRYRLFLLDLDDTLYLERDYVLSGLQAVAIAMGEYGIAVPAAKSWLYDCFRTQGRERIFDQCLAHFAMDDKAPMIDELVCVYRAHRPAICLLPGVDRMLDQLQAIGEIIIVTDGLPLMQAKKCEALGLRRWTSHWFLCWEHGTPKPDASVLSAVIGARRRQALLIGDNPAHDLCLAQRLGIDAVRVRQGRFANETSAPWHALFEIDNITHLLDLKS